MFNFSDFTRFKERYKSGYNYVRWALLCRMSHSIITLVCKQYFDWKPEKTRRVIDVIVKKVPELRAQKKREMRKAKLRKDYIWRGYEC